MAVDRQLRLVLLQGPEADVVEAIVSVTRGEVDRWEIVRDVRPPLQMEESILVLAALHEHPEWNAALDRRGIVDTSLVQIDPWPAGTFGLGHEEGRRITRCLAYLRESKEDNGYARPLEGLLAFVDMGRGEVLEVSTSGSCPFPPKAGSYYPEDNGPLRTDLKPLEITQPEGPSFEVEGNLVRWQKWSLRVGMDPLEGLVLYTRRLRGRRPGPADPATGPRSARWWCPTATPARCTAWKSAFDAGEWGLGRMANSLTLGCDCLGEILYLDDVFADERGKPDTRPNAICMHEEDYGILWKHVDIRRDGPRSAAPAGWSSAPSPRSGTTNTASTGTSTSTARMQLEVKLTGIMSTMAVGPTASRATTPALIAPRLAAPYHQHLFNVRLDMEVDGPDNSVYEVDAVPPRRARTTRGGNAFGPKATLLESELAARRDVDPSRSRSLEDRQPLPSQRAGTADGLQAGAGVDADAAGRSGLERRRAGPPSPRTICG